MARRARHAAPEEAAPEVATPEEGVLETRPLFLGALDVATGAESVPAQATTSAMDALSGSLDGAGETAPPERTNGKRAAVFAAVGGAVALGVIGTLVVLLPTDAAEKPAAEVGPAAPVVPSSTSSTAPSTSYPAWTPSSAPVQPPEPVKPKPSAAKPPPKKQTPVTPAKPPASKPAPGNSGQDWQDAIESAINQWQEWYQHHSRH